MKNILIGLLVLGVIGGIVIVTNSKKEPVPDDTVLTPVPMDGACTKEALMCPDGKVVGRSGPDCSFSACTYAGPYRGRLNKHGNEYTLVTGAPMISKEEVTYSMPLDITISNTLENLSDKFVSVSGSFNSGNTLKVSSIKEIPKEEAGGENAWLRIGETSYANGVRITLNKKISDNRCPIDVQCITAGEAKFEVKLQSDTESEVVNMSSVGAPHLFDTYKISLASVSPEPKSTREIKSEDYKIIFKVERRTN